MSVPLSLPPLLPLSLTDPSTRTLQRLMELLKRMRREQPSSYASAAPLANGFVDSMIVIDRQVDMVSAFCTQLTYEGLVDEVVGIKHGAPSLSPLPLRCSGPD